MDIHSLCARLLPHAFICLRTSCDWMYRLVAATMAFFCLYSSKPISSNPRRTLNRKYRPSSPSLAFSLANLSAVFSVSVAIARVKRTLNRSKDSESGILEDDYSGQLEVDG